MEVIYAWKVWTYLHKETKKPLLLTKDGNPYCIPYFAHKDLGLKIMEGMSQVNLDNYTYQQEVVIEADELAFLFYGLRDREEESHPNWKLSEALTMDPPDFCAP